MNVNSCLFILLSLFVSNTAYVEGAPQNGYIHTVVDYFKNNGMVNTISIKLKQSVRDAQVYNDKNFHSDWEVFTTEPGLFNTFTFIRNATFPMVVRCVGLIGDSLSVFVNKMIGFLYSKCDIYIGSNAPLHPTKLLQQDKESVSFILFVCSLTFLVIFIQFYTIQNLLIITAGSFLAYSFGGPYTCLKMVFFIVAVCWYIIDMAMYYPIHAAAFIIGYFILAKLLSHFFSRNSTYVITSTDIPELDYLSDRVQGVEAQTDTIKRKIDHLTKLIEHMADEKDSSYSRY